MGDIGDAQAAVDRSIITSLDQQFARLHSRSCSLISATPAELLYKSIEVGSGSWPSVGESVLRSVAAVERTFGGIIANLWDDPFEWTLPEQLGTSAKVLEHLAEVETLRARAFASFASDSCLRLQVATPAAHEPLIQLLLTTLVQATSFQSQAMMAEKALSSITSPGFII
jgi:hypothetical protein